MNLLSYTFDQTASGKERAIRPETKGYLRYHLSDSSYAVVYIGESGIICFDFAGCISSGKFQLGFEATK